MDWLLSWLVVCVALEEISERTPGRSGRGWGGVGISHGGAAGQEPGPGAQGPHVDDSERV